MVIKINNLSILYSTAKVLNDISLEVPDGAVGLLGPNGAGKSTLIKTLLGFLTPDAGGASVLGMDGRTHAVDIRQQVGYMPENDCLMPGRGSSASISYSRFT